MGDADEVPGHRLLRRARLRHAVPTGGLEELPAEGMAPPGSGNRLLDLNTGFVDEFESKMRRTEVLLRATWQELRASRGLRVATSILTALRLVLVGAIIAAAAAGIADIANDRDASLNGGTLIVVGALVALWLVLVPLGVVSFGFATAEGIGRARGETLTVTGALRRTLRATPGLLRLGVARFFGSRNPESLTSLYEALMVFVVPVMIDRCTSYAEAQRESERIVAARWGPGRYRASGIPTMSPQDALYSYLRRTGRTGGTYLVALAAIGCFLAPIVVVLVTESIGTMLAVGAVTWGIPLVAGTAWVWWGKPMVEGLLRGHLYVYGEAGEARPPFTSGVLHACLREEARATFGKAQRAPVPGGDPAMGGGAGAAGVAGAIDRTAAGGWGHVQEEAGVSVQDIGGVVADARELWRDSRAVMAAVRARHPMLMDTEEICSATPVPRERCVLAIASLADQRELLEYQDLSSGVLRYRARRATPKWWERLHSQRSSSPTVRDAPGGTAP